MKSMLHRNTVAYNCIYSYSDFWSARLTAANDRFQTGVLIDSRALNYLASEVMLVKKIFIWFIYFMDQGTGVLRISVIIHHLIHAFYLQLKWKKTHYTHHFAHCVLSILRAGTPIPAGNQVIALSSHWCNWTINVALSMSVVCLYFVYVGKGHLLMSLESLDSKKLIGTLYFVVVAKSIYLPCIRQYNSSVIQWMSHNCTYSF